MVPARRLRCPRNLLRALRDGGAPARGRRLGRAREIIALAGIPEITIGETIADVADPGPLPVIAVEEPALGDDDRHQHFPPGRPVRLAPDGATGEDRLQAELVGNVAIRVLETDRKDTWEVQGRGELQLAVLVESMRREGFELTVGKPRVVLREVDGAVHEPIERLSIDVPEDFLGVVTQMLALRGGRHGEHGQPRHRLGPHRLPRADARPDRLPDRVPHETRGSGILHSVFEGYEPWQGDIRTRPTGSLVADRRGRTRHVRAGEAAGAGAAFVGPGDEVYEGMVIGENARQDDLDVNAVREKKQTNVRAAGSDDTIKLVPAHRLSLDQALEFIREDEAVEVTPEAVRLRKVVLEAGARQKESRQKKYAEAPGLSEALVIIDVQNDFTHGGALAVPDGDDVIKPLNELASGSTWCSRRATGTRPTISPLSRQGGPWPPHCVQERPAPSCIPGSTSRRSTRWWTPASSADVEGYSAFDGTDFEARLRAATWTRSWWPGWPPTTACAPRRWTRASAASRSRSWSTRAAGSRPSRATWPARSRRCARPGSSS